MNKEKELIDKLIDLAFAEDIGDGDHTTLSCIPATAMGKSKLLIKEAGVLAGIEVAKEIFNRFDPTMKVEVFINDGTEVKPGDVAMVVEGKVQSLLQTERLMLNVMQRMSGIATTTRKYVKALEGTKTLAVYGNSYYEGNPALTCHAVGKGQVLHLGATFNKENTEALFDYLKIKEPFKEYIEAPETAEVIMREKDGEKYIFVLNYQAEKIEYTLQKPMIALYDKTEATGRCSLPAFGTAVYKVIE